MNMFTVTQTMRTIIKHILCIPFREFIVWGITLSRGNHPGLIYLSSAGNITPTGLNNLARGDTTNKFTLNGLHKKNPKSKIIDHKSFHPLTGLHKIAWTPIQTFITAVKHTLCIPVGEKKQEVNRQPTTKFTLHMDT